MFEGEEPKIKHTARDYTAKSRCLKGRESSTSKSSCKPKSQGCLRKQIVLKEGFVKKQRLLREESKRYLIKSLWKLLETLRR